LVFPQGIFAQAAPLKKAVLRISCLQELITTTHHLLSLMRRVATGQPAPPAKKVK
jgi:hypothetical protein